MNLFAVTGKPIIHSKSPLMMNAAFSKAKFNARYIRLAANSGTEALTTMQRYKIQGMNVTAPFKAEMATSINNCSDAVQKIGGSNTVFYHNGNLEAHNTDYLGVPKSLIVNGITLQNKNALVIGAGGAGRAAAYGLQQYGASVTLANRTFAKAEKFANRIGCKAVGLEHLADLVKAADIIVSTASTQIPLIESDWLSSEKVVMDANYQYVTFQKMVEKAGAKFISGKEWLWQQALPAFDFFIKNKIKTSAISELAIEDIMYEALNLPTVKKQNIALIGFPCSGKSSIASVLTQHLGWKIMDIDAMIVEKIKISIADYFEQYGETKFRAIESECLEIAVNTPNVIIACGGGVVVEPKNRKLLINNSLTIWLMVTPETAIERVKNAERPLFNVENPLAKAKELYQQRIGWYAETADIAFDTEITDIETVAKSVQTQVQNLFQQTTK